MYSQKKNAVVKMMIALLVTLVTLGSVSHASLGQASDWSAPQALSSAEISSWFPDIATDEYGNVHVVWASAVLGFDTVLYTASEEGQTWGTPNDVFALPQVGSSSAATRPSLLVDRNSNLNLTFVDLTTAYYSRVPLWDASYALSWPSKSVISGKQTAYYSRMAIDSKGVLHLIYTENVPSNICSNCYHVFYRQSLDDGSTWSEPKDIVDDQVGAVKPQILIDKKNNLHLVWESGLGGGLGQLSDPTTVAYAASYDGGKTWTKPMAFPIDDGELAKNIAIGLDSNNQLVVAWWLRPADRIIYQISADDGKSWSDPAPIPDVWGAAAVYKSNLDDYAMANDSAGNLHLVAVARRSSEQDGLDLVDLVWNGTEWSEPDVIASYQGDVPEWPRIAVSNGNQLNVVWFVRDELHIWDSDHGRYRIWFSERLTDAPAVSPEPLPSLTPTLEPTPTLAITSTPESSNVGQAMEVVPTLVPEDRIPPVDVPTSEMDYIPLLIKALLPSVLFVAGIVAVVLFRRR